MPRHSLTASPSAKPSHPPSAAHPLPAAQITYQAALAAAFVEGLIFIFLSVSGIRGRFVELIPKSLMYATAVGIGAFLCFIGLQQSEGLGVITYDGATLVALGACPPDERANMYEMRAWDAYWHDFCWTAWQQVWGEGG